MNRSNKLSLFLGLGCKPMKRVMGYHPDWEKDITDKKIGNEPKDLEKWNPDIYIEAIPERVMLSRFEKNFKNIDFNDTLWKDKHITWYEYIYWEHYERTK